MLGSLFNKFLILSENVRNGYVDSLSNSNKDWEKYIPCNRNEIPLLYKVIYSNVQGTKKLLKDQRLMDFMPGYRLIHIFELIEESKSLYDISKHYNLEDITLILPLLTNYSSDYICYAKTINNNEYIISIFHDDINFYIIHESIEAFFITLCEFYKNKVYFVDKDGFLDYDIEKKIEIGRKFNENLLYWEIE